MLLVTDTDTGRTGRLISIPFGDYYVSWNDRPTPEEEKAWKDHAEGERLVTLFTNTRAGR